MGIEFGFNSLWDHNYLRNTAETTTQVISQFYHEPEFVLEVAEHAYDEFADASGPERARMLSSLTSNVIVGIATPTFGGMTKLGIFAKLHKVDLNISGKVARVRKIGWKLGDPITNLTAKGNIPTWSAVRQRFWKNEALLNRGTYS